MDIENDPKSPAERLRAFFQSSVRDEESDDEDKNLNASISRGFRAFFNLQKSKDEDDDDDEDEEDDYFPQDKRTKSPIRDIFGKNKLQRMPSETDSGFLVACTMSKN
jgi:hypothetical protein